MALQDMIVKQAIEVIIKLSQVALKAVSSHIQKNAVKYASGVIGAGTVAGGKFIYNRGKKKGHTEGRKEGTAEQGQKDEAKFQQQHEQHESDRRKWNKEKQIYEDIIDEVNK